MGAFPVRNASFFMSEYLFSIILLVTLVLSYLERRDLHNRLMAKDLSDFKANTQKDETNQKEEEDTTIPLDQAYEDITKDLNV